MIFIVYILCFVSILKGVVQYIYFNYKNKHYYKATGIIKENYIDEEINNIAGYRHYYPVVEYTDKDGEILNITSNNYNPDRPMYAVGTKVKLLVNPNDSRRFLFDEKVDRLIIPLVWIGIGLIGIIICYNIELIDSLLSI